MRDEDSTGGEVSLEILEGCLISDLAIISLQSLFLIIIKWRQNARHGPLVSPPVELGARSRAGPLDLYLIIKPIAKYLLIYYIYSSG